jgi:uncharacterized cupin superfamily protein
MRVYPEADTPWRCGHWNGSSLGITMTGVMTRVPSGEADHAHDFHEYYIVLHGRGTLCVAGQDVPLEAGNVVMVEPGERHRVTWIDPDAGVQWIVVKERSMPNDRIALSEADNDSGESD